MKYQAVLFDIDHTVITDGHVEKHVLCAMLDEFQARARGGTTVFEDVKREAADILEIVRRGPMTIIEGVSRQFVRVLDQHPELKIDPEVEAFKFCERALQDLPARIQVLPGARELLAALDGAGVRTGFISNGWIRLQKEKARFLGYDGPVFISEEVRYWKPDARAFQFPLATLGLDSATTLYVGDNPAADVKGAKGVGMDAAWVDEKAAPFPHESVPAPDFHVESLHELKERLGI